LTLRILCRVAERCRESLPEGGWDFHAIREIDPFGTFQKLPSNGGRGVAEGSFALVMPRGRSRAKVSTRPSSAEGKAGGDFGVGRPRRNESMSLKKVLALFESAMLQRFDFERRLYRSNGSV
jgi:hypothetical protein